MLWTFKKAKAFQLDWPLTDSPIPISLILLTYGFFVFKWGKLFMENRKPYNVKKIMLIYNGVQVVYNSIIFLFAVYYILLSPSYDFRCMESLPADHPRKFTEMYFGYAYFINKILDLLDTKFFVLRKSYKQITLLHVYHHIGMVFGGYIHIRFYGTGGHFSITALLNTLVHVVMYSYYFIAALNPPTQKSLWWKRYITIMQMVQFIIIFLHTLYVIVYSKDCTLPRFLLWMGLIQSATMLLMFSSFYVKAYVKPNKDQQEQKSPATQVKQD